MFEVSRKKYVLTIVMNRPEKHNRLDTGSMNELSLLLEKVNNDTSCRVIIITGAQKVFCAGADIREFQEKGLLAQRSQADSFRRMCTALHQLSKPFIAKVNGIAIGGGMAMVSLAHLAIASTDAKFGTPEINVGAFPSMVMAAIMRGLTRKQALKMILTGEMISAEEAERIGLINMAVDPHELDSITEAEALALAEKSPAAMSLGLDSIRLSADMTYPQALEYLKEVNTLIRNTEDFSEGSEAFIQKRRPVWKGK